MVPFEKDKLGTIDELWVVTAFAIQAFILMSLTWALM